MRRIVTLALASVLAACGSGEQAVKKGDAHDPKQVALGKTVYAAHCASCHGANLEGQPNWAEKLPNGRLPAPPHDVTGHTYHHADDELFAMTKNGASSATPAGYQSDMPAFAQVLSDDEIWAVLAFIKSTWPAQIQLKQGAFTQRARAAAAGH